MPEGWRQGRVYGLLFPCQRFNVGGLRFSFRAGPRLKIGARQGTESASGVELAEVSGLQFQYAQLLWSEPTSTIDQFGRFQATSAADNSQGLIFRSTPNNGDSGLH